MSTARWKTVRWLPVATAVVVTLAGLCWTTSSSAQQFREVEQRKLKHILLKTEEQADQIIAEFRAGADFVMLARKNSYDVVTKRLGGDLGWATRGTYDPGFEQAAFSIPTAGEVGKGRSQHGWHVILLEETKILQIPVKPGVKPPVAQPVQPRPQVQRPDDIEAVIEFEKKAYRPGEDIYFTITMRNKSNEERSGDEVKRAEGQDLRVFPPSAWPLGLTIRYEKGRGNRALDQVQIDPPTESAMIDLSAGDSHTERFRLQDYLSEVVDWPLIRVNWRGAVMMEVLEKSHPELSQEEGWSARKAEWRYYFSEERRINVLKNYRPEDPWYALFYLHGGTMWAKIEDCGVPGVTAAWIELVRNEVYDRIPFTTLQEGAFLLGGDPSGSGTTPGNTSLPKGWRQAVPSIEPGDLALKVSAVKGGTEGIGSMLFFALENPGVLAGQAVRIGRPVLGQRSIDRVVEQMSAPRKPAITRVDVYPADLIPPKVLALLDEGAHGAAAEGAADGATSRPATIPGDPGGAAVEAPGGTLEFAPDLPRVMMITEQGRLVIELFEDHAPNTVAHFLELVEHSFYDKNLIHTVDRVGRTGFLQAGSPDNTRQGSLSYHIPDERNDLPHTRGMVALATIPGKPNTGGSQFFINLGDNPSYRGEFTVFGRVVEGIDVIDRIRAGQYIKGIRVVSKRDHEYTVEKVGQ